VVLWVYFSFAAYSAASFSPAQPDWWLHTWLWMEPIRMVLRTAVTVKLYNEIRVDNLAIARISALIAFGDFIAVFQNVLHCGCWQFSPTQAPPSSTGELHPRPLGTKILISGR